VIVSRWCGMSEPLKGLDQGGSGRVEVLKVQVLMAYPLTVPILCPLTLGLQGQGQGSGPEQMLESGLMCAWVSATSGGLKEEWTELSAQPRSPSITD
jgi:hypothetical protein